MHLPKLFCNAAMTLHYTTPTLAWTLSNISEGLIYTILHLQSIERKYFVYFRALDPTPVLELVAELDPVLEIDVASSPELKPVPVLELELGFV